MAEPVKKYPEFQKDDYFKIDVECHLSGEANKKYFNYFPEYRKWVYGTAETARAFNAVPHHVTKDWKEPPVTKAEKSDLAEEDQLIVYLDRELSEWSLLDLGLFLQNIALVAVNYGLGTCILALIAGYHMVLRGILGIPDSKKIICGVAIGYPDWQHPANRCESPRETVANFSGWYGF